MRFVNPTLHILNTSKKVRLQSGTINKNAEKSVNREHLQVFLDFQWLYYDQ